jgi:hypothetical protein
MNTEALTTAKPTAEQHQSHASIFDSSHWSHSVVGVGGRGWRTEVDRYHCMIDICVECEMDREMNTGLE